MVNFMNNPQRKTLAHRFTQIERINTDLNNTFSLCKSVLSVNICVQNVLLCNLWLKMGGTK